jgi:tetratricopeptide (TPR) repeat protein
MGMGRFAPAAEAFVEAIRRDDSDVRAYWGAGHAYYEAGESKQNQGPAASIEVTFESMTVDNMYHEALRYFRRALEMTNDKSERDQLSASASAVEKALARKAGRL